MSRNRITNNGFFSQAVDGGDGPEDVKAPRDVDAFTRATLSYKTTPSVMSPTQGVLLSANIIHIFLSQGGHRGGLLDKLNRRQELTRASLKAFTGRSLQEALMWDFYEGVEIPLKLPHLANRSNNIIEAGDNLIVVVDRSSAAKVIADVLIEKLDEELRNRVALIDQDTTLEERNKIIDGFLGGSDGPEINVLLVPSEAVQQGFFGDRASSEKLSNNYNVLFFDLLKNNPSAAVDFANLFRSSDGGATEMDYFAISEMDDSESPPFHN